jgi:hypothetical protein
MMAASAGATHSFHKTVATLIDVDATLARWPAIGTTR